MVQYLWKTELLHFTLLTPQSTWMFCHTVWAPPFSLNTVLSSPNLFPTGGSHCSIQSVFTHRTSVDWMLCKIMFCMTNSRNIEIAEIHEVILHQSDQKMTVFTSIFSWKGGNYALKRVCAHAFLICHLEVTCVDACRTPNGLCSCHITATSPVRVRLGTFVSYLRLYCQTINKC